MNVLLRDFYIVCKVLRIFVLHMYIRYLTIQCTWRTRRSHIKKLQSSGNISTNDIKLDQSIKLRQHCLLSLISETYSLNLDTCFALAIMEQFRFQYRTWRLISYHRKRIYPSSFFSPKTRAPSWNSVCLIFKIKENKKRYKYRRIAPFMCLFSLKVT